MGRLWIFFMGGRGGKRKCQDMVIRVGRWTTRDFKQTHFVIYYMLNSGGFATHEDSQGAAAPRSVTDSTEEWV